MESYRIKCILRNFLLFCVGFTVYQCIEGIFKNIPGFFYGAESFAMGILGGLSLLLIGFINEKISPNMPIWLQALIGCVIITVLEFVTGCLFNLWLCPLINKPVIWDYSSLPGNFMGQICPQFTALWFVFSLLIIVVDDFLRWAVFNEEKPHYTLWWK